MSIVFATPRAWEAKSGRRISLHLHALGFHVKARLTTVDGRRTTAHALIFTVAFVASHGSKRRKKLPLEPWGGGMSRFRYAKPDPGAAVEAE